MPGLLAGCRATLPPEFEDCRAETYAVLESAGIDPGRVRRFSSTPDRVFFHGFYGDSDDRIVGYSNWLEIRGCEGPVVLRFSRFCQLRNVYVRDHCGPTPAAEPFGPASTGPGGPAPAHP